MIGTTKLEKGYIYAPYIPLMVTKPFDVDFVETPLPELVQLELFDEI